MAGQDSRSADEDRLEQLRQSSRLAIPDFVRIPAASAASFAVGMSLGLVQGSKMAGLRFRAEHAHKLPTSTTGWYLYHKSKNYHLAYGGIREGLRMGVRVSFWTTAMFSIETLFDNYRGTADLLNTVLACATVAGGFSLWSMSTPPSSVVVAKPADSLDLHAQTDFRWQWRLARQRVPSPSALFTAACKILLGS